MGPGGRTASAFGNADRGLGDRNDLRAIHFGQALACGALGGPSALDTRCCRRHALALSQRGAAVSADHTDQALGSMARGYDPLFRCGLPDSSRQLSPPG